MCKQNHPGQKVIDRPSFMNVSIIRNPLFENTVDNMSLGSQNQKIQMIKIQENQRKEKKKKKKEEKNNK